MFSRPKYTVTLWTVCVTGAVKDKDKGCKFQVVTVQKTQFRLGLSLPLGDLRFFPPKLNNNGIYLGETFS
jgi:hypothetical protein